MVIGNKVMLPEIEVGADAAAGSEAGTITVPAGETWLLKSVSVASVQGATQTPTVSLVITIGGTAVFKSQGSTTQQAVSTTTFYSWAPGLVLSGQVGATTAVRSQGALPEGLVLPAGSTITTDTVGIGANTNYGVMSALVEHI